MVGLCSRAGAAGTEKDGEAAPMTSRSLKNGSSSGEDFDRALAKIAVVQVCESLGFTAFQKSAVEILTDIGIRYLVNLANAAHSYANLAGRTQCNSLDVILALEDLGTGPRIVAEPSRPLSTSSVLRDLMKYVEYTEEIPFARPVPHFPVAKKRAPSPSFLQLGEAPPYTHVPAWLPAFPDPHTYKSTPVWNERKTDLQTDQREQAKQRRKAERSLMSLHLRLGSSADGTSPPDAAFKRPLLEPPSSAAGPLTALGAPGVATHPTPLTSKQQWPSRDQEQRQVLAMLEAEHMQNKAKSKKTLDVQNPFLADPVPSGEVGVSPINPYRHASEEGPSRKVTLPTAVQAFAPALQAVTEGEPMDSNPFPALDYSAYGALPDAKDRAPVHLTFDWGRKTRAKAATARLSLGLRDGSPSRVKGSSVMANGKDEEKDDKRKRVEQILAQAMDGMDNDAQA